MPETYLRSIPEAAFGSRSVAGSGRRPVWLGGALVLWVRVCSVSSVGKAIPASRDRLQSRVLVGTGAPVFACVLWLGVRDALAPGRPGAGDLLPEVLISAVFALAAWRLRAATPAAALCGGAICLAVMFFGREPGTHTPLHTGLVPLLLLFALTFGATRLGRERKARAGLAEDRKGRNAAQVLANLAAAALASFLGWWIAHSYQHAPDPGQSHTGIAGTLAMVAALAEATADTVSSEIGQAFGGTPRTVLTLRPVPAGTDGAMSWTGTTAGMIGAAILAVSAVPALGLTWAEAAVVWAAGVAGLFFDSLLGATAERRGWLGNDLVNFSSTAFSAVLGWVISRNL